MLISAVSSLNTAKSVRIILLFTWYIHRAISEYLTRPQQLKLCAVEIWDDLWMIYYKGCRRKQLWPIWKYIHEIGERGKVVGWGTMLEAGRWRVRFPLRSLHFSIDLNLPAALWPLGSTQPLIEITTRNLPGDKWRPAHKADNLTAIRGPIL
jgi:hypothetical protein